MSSVALLPLIVTAIGLGIVGLIAGVYLYVQSKGVVDQRIQQFVETSPASAAVGEDDAESSLSQLRRQFNSIFSVLDSTALERQLTAANWQITGSEYWFMRVGAAIVGFMLGLLVTRSVLSAAGIAIIAYIIPGFLLFRSIQARQKQFQNQLIDSLTLIRGAVAAGYSFQQSLNVVIQEMASPTGDEFRQVRREVELGLPLGRALTNMARRMESDDFNLVVAVVTINMQVGGNLTTILNVVLETIRERAALFSEMRALTAYANFASYLLTILPFVTLVILSIMSPVYWRQLFQPGATRLALIYAACSLVVGNFLLRRIAKVKV